MFTTAQRLELQALLVALLGSDHVYFQPPPGVQLQFPCIMYSRTQLNTRFADNIPYSLFSGYQVTVVDRDPDSLIPAKVAALPRCIFDRYYAAENLNHDVFTLFF